MIVNGSEVTPHSIPWQVLVRVQTISGKMRRCGGTLLTARHVLTAAHCIIGPVHVVVEEHDLDSEKDGIKHEMCRTESHPSYNVEARFNNDFAILHLKEPVEINDRAVTACLPDPSMGGDFLSKKKMTVSGWGKLKHEGESPRVLHSVDVTGDTNDHCAQDYNNTGFVITKSMLCAGEHSGAVDACQGDSGGNYVGAQYIYD